MKSYLNHPTLAWENEKCDRDLDSVACELPLQILINGNPFSVTLRTPGNEEHLVRGLLHSEGVWANPPAGPVQFVSLNADTIDVRAPSESFTGRENRRRSLMASSSCGACGVESSEALQVISSPVEKIPSEKFSLQELFLLQKKMRARQSIFAQTGGTHAAAICSLVGDILSIQEDIGRHNAVDKAIGEVLADGTLPRARILLVSGRASFEIVSKAAMAGIPILVAISSVSSLAIATAEEKHLTLIGFAREPRAMIYTHPDRIRDLKV